MAVGAIIGSAAAGAAVSGIASGVSSGVSTSKTNSTNLQIAQMNNEFNERMLDKQLAYNTEMYERQLSDSLAYSDPSYIVGRLNDAGLNGKLLMSSGSDLGSVSSTGVSAQGINPPTASPVSVDYSGYNGIGQAIAGAFGLYQDFLNSQQERSYKQAQTEQINIENKYKAQQAVAEISKTLASASSERERSENLKILNQFQDSIYRQEQTLRDQEIRKAESDYQMQCLQIAMTDLQLQNMPEMLRLSIANQGADLGLKIANRELTRKQAEHEAAKIAETLARTSLAGAQEQQVQAQTGLIQSQAAGQDTANRFADESFELRKKQIEASILEMTSSSVMSNILKSIPFGLGKFGRIR